MEGAEAVPAAPTAPTGASTAAAAASAEETQSHKLSSLFRPEEEEEDEDEDDAPLVPAPSMDVDGVRAQTDGAMAKTWPMADDEMMSVGAGGIFENAAASSSSSLGGLISSQDFTDALAAITADPWDCHSWYVYLSEAEQGHSGSVSVDDAYSKFLTQFPRAANYWNKEVQYFLVRNDFVMCESIFAKCLAKPRYVDLWCSYIEMIKRKANLEPAVGKTQSQLTTERTSLEAAYEKALESVGMHPGSGIIWREYIDFVRSWPEASNNVESGRKLLALRKLYQRALCVPTDGLDSFWKEYEALERSAGELLAERVLPEYSEKYLHAAAVYKDRMRLHYHIDFDRLAVPPMQSVSEVRQLLAWDNLIKYERTNPDNQTPEQHRTYQLLVFDQFISCFRLHAEVWIELSKLELQQQPPCSTEARTALKEGIELIPDVALLRIALAEFEENEGMFDAAREVYRCAFEAIPCSLTFSCFQRYTRRREGIAVARRLFSETLPLRLSRKLGVDVYIAHALLELEVNCKPDIALKILQLAYEFDSHSCMSNIQYIRLYVRLLLRLGDLQHIRWIMQRVLSDEMGCWTSSVFTTKQQLGMSNFSLSMTSALGPGGVVVSNVVASGIPDTILNGDRTNGSSISDGARGGDAVDAIKADENHGGSVGSKATNGSSNSSQPAHIIFSLPDQLQLWDDYLIAETTLGLSSVARLDELRGYRDRVKHMLMDIEATRAAAAGGVVGVRDATSRPNIFGIFNSCADLCERYTVGPIGIPDNDEALRYLKVVSPGTVVTIVCLGIAAKASGS
jgi:tetratricopeptide (TPR) repeat protein